MRHSERSEESDALMYIYVHSALLYAVADRTPRIYAWMNEPFGGIIRYASYKIIL